MPQIRSPADNPQKRTWRIKPDEEYIWSMRLQKVARDRSSFGEEVISSQSVETISSMEKLTPTYVKPEKLSEQIKMLASFLPDEVLYDIDDYTPREIECCLLYCRITGVYHNLERVYESLNNEARQRVDDEYDVFVAGLIQEVLTNGGDILKTTPTTLVAIWKCTKGTYIAQQIHIAIDCALVMRKLFGTLRVYEGVPIKVYFGINSGPLYLGLIGNEKATRFIFFGPVYEEIKKVMKTIETENILICPLAMQFIHISEYEVEQIEDGPYFQVVGLSAMWKPVRRIDYEESSANQLAATSTSCVTLNTDVTLALSQQEYTAEYQLRPLLHSMIEHGSAFLKKTYKFFQEGIRAEFLSDHPSKMFISLKETTLMTILISTSISKWIRIFKATDEIYKIVQRYGFKYKGYVYYVSILDNSIMLSILFGLRGAAHMLQHRSALKCAYEIMSILKDTNKIIGVSIAVSSEQAYYSQNGQDLRKDVVLFKCPSSVPLALAFSDKLVCDEGTFIHSKMDPRCFHLIKEQSDQNDNLPAGSIYELISDDSDLIDELPIYNQPMVGRDREIKIYKNLLGKFLKSLKSSESIIDSTKAVLIRGYPKEGKTRLLHECIKVTDSLVPVHYISLQYGKASSPYCLIRKIFSIEFDCDLMSSAREDRVLQLNNRLSDMPRADLLWAINPVFHVNFPETEDYWNYSAGEKFLTTLKILKHLCYKTFVIPWIIAVDDVHHVDEESWRIVEILLETNTFFLIMTGNRDHSTSSFMQQTSFTKSPFVARIKMERLNPSFISSIACQHFNVFAISVDLEYILQKKSNGNIGYIRNLLTNLRHRGYFTFKDVTYDQLVEDQLAAPLLSFLIPMTDSEKESLMISIKKRKDEENNYEKILWNLFVDSFQNTRFNHKWGKVYQIFLKDKKIPVCYLKKPLDMKDISEELSIVIHITQVFDSLSCSEQVILQCCSILGDTFPRILLEHVLSLDYITLLAPTIKLFFELGILCCNHGDFTDGTQYTVIRSDSRQKYHTDRLICRCRGIQESSQTLPSYAFCGLLRFRHSRFREHVYEKLNPAQVVDYHTKVLIYLNEENKRCRACDRGPFVFYIRKRLDDYDDKSKKRGKTTQKKMEPMDTDLMPTTMFELFYDDPDFFGKMSMSARMSSRGSMDSSFSRDLDGSVIESRQRQ